jgi:hypothetical protein
MSVFSPLKSLLFQIIAQIADKGKKDMAQLFGWKVKLEFAQANSNLSLKL